MLGASSRDCSEKCCANAGVVAPGYVTPWAAPGMPAKVARFLFARHAPVRCVQVLGAEGRPGALEHVRDPQGHLQGACHVFGHAWALVRPDSYVAATGESVDADLVNALACALGTAGESE